MEQTFITRFTDEENRTINFERWSFKKANTCLQNTIQLMKNNLYFACLRADHKRQPINNVTIEDNKGETMYKYSFNDFLALCGREI